MCSKYFLIYKKEKNITFYSLKTVLEKYNNSFTHWFFIKIHGNFDFGADIDLIHSFVSWST